MSELIGSYLKERREVRGLGLRQMARQVGITHQVLQRLESDRETCPVGPQVLARIAQALGEDTDTFLLRAGILPQDVVQQLQSHPERLSEVRAVLRK